MCYGLVAQEEGNGLVILSTFELARLRRWSAKKGELTYYITFKAKKEPVSTNLALYFGFEWDDANVDLDDKPDDIKSEIEDVQKSMAIWKNNQNLGFKTYINYDSLCEGIKELYGMDSSGTPLKDNYFEDCIKENTDYGFIPKRFESDLTLVGGAPVWDGSTSQENESPGSTAGEQGV